MQGKSKLLMARHALRSFIPDFYTYPSKLFMKKIFSLILLLCALKGLGQTPIPEFGVFEPGEISMKTCTFDPEADAVVIFDHASSGYDDHHRLITNRRIRLKILKEKGVEHGNIRIVFYHDNEFEFIRNIEAVVLSQEENGPVLQQLDRKTIFTRKLNPLYSEMTFALPKVKVGSLIEYHYQ